VAIVLEAMGLRYVKEKPDAHGTAHAIIAIVCGVFAC